MFTVLNSYRDKETTLYAVRDFTTGEDLEIIPEADLRLLLAVSLPMKDVNGGVVRLEGDTLVCNVEDITDVINEDMAEEESDEDDGFYDLYGDDEEPVEEEPESEESCEDDDEDFDLYAGYDIEEEEDPEGSVVSKLYAMLTEEQITVLRRYYLWFSLRLFTDAQKDPTMGFKSKTAAMRKRNALDQLKGDGDYRYAGFLDTGSKAAGYTCSLGHPLRYMHLAWDITVGDIETAFFGQDYNANYEEVIESNNCIIFGIKCIGDFFEVDDECIKSLQRAQRDSLKDMSLLYDIYTNADVEAVKRSFDLLDSVMKVTDRYDMKLKMMKDKEPTVPFSVAAFYHQFRAVGLIPPKSLVQEIRSCLVGWTNGRKYFNNCWTGELRYPDQSFYPRLQVVVGRAYSGVVSALADRSSQLYRGYSFEGFNSLLLYVYLMFTYEICGYYKYTASKDGFHDEGGYNRKLVGERFDYLYRKSLSSTLVNFEFSLENLKRAMSFASTCMAMQETCKRGSHLISVYRRSDGIKELSLGDAYVMRYEPAAKKVIETWLEGRYDHDSVMELFDFFAVSVFGKMNVMADMLTQRVLNSVSFLQGGSVDRWHFNLDIIAPALEKAFKEYEQYYAELSEFSKSYAIQAKEQDEREEAERRAEEARKQFEREEAERERARQEAEARKNTTLPTTRRGVVDYLAKQDVDAITDPKLKFAKDVLKTLINNGKEPSDRQFQYLQPLFEAVSGGAYVGVGKAPEKVLLADRMDIKSAIAWVFSNKVSAREIAGDLHIDDFDKLTSILQSIEKYGQISERQMKYAQMAIDIVDESKNR